MFELRACRTRRRRPSLLLHLGGRHAPPDYTWACSLLDRGKFHWWTNEQSCRVQRGNISASVGLVWCLLPLVSAQGGSLYSVPRELCLTKKKNCHLASAPLHSPSLFAPLVVCDDSSSRGVATASARWAVRDKAGVLKGGCKQTNMFFLGFN